jgi:hypothetical protein
MFAFFYAATNAGSTTRPKSVAHNDRHGMQALWVCPASMTMG